MSKKGEYLPFLIIGSTALVIFTVGYIFRKTIKTAIDIASSDGVGEAFTYVFTDNNTYHLNQLNPKYKSLFQKLLAKMQSLGYVPHINSSYRDFAKQAKEHEANSLNAPAGLSLHNYGVAIDVQMSKNGKVWGKDTTDAEWNATGIPQYAKSIGLQWGGDFAGYQDAVHFQVAGFTGSQLQQLAYKQFGTTDPNKIQGNKLNIV